MNRYDTKTAFCVQAGISLTALNTYISKPFSIPSAEILDRMVYLTSCSPAWLLSGVGEPFFVDQTVQQVIEQIAIERTDELTAKLARSLADLESIRDVAAESATRIRETLDNLKDDPD